MKIEIEVADNGLIVTVLDAGGLIPITGRSRHVYQFDDDDDDSRALAGVHVLDRIAAALIPDSHRATIFTMPKVYEAMPDPVQPPTAPSPIDDDDIPF